jgi:hypothetical protein
MSKFIIEEQLTNSTHRDAQGEPVTEVLFTVVSWSGRNFLYKGKFIESEWQGENKLAECVNGDYKERFGGLHGWLKHVLKRERKNVESYTHQIELLREKLEYSARLRWDISGVVRDEN